MKKYLPGFLVLMISVLAGCCIHSKAMLSAAPLSQSTLVAGITSDTVALVHRDGDNDLEPFCSGVWVSDTVILTAFHCAAARISTSTSINEDTSLDVVGTEIRYITHEEVTGIYEETTALHSCIVVATDSPHDLALLKVTGLVPKHSFAEVSQTAPAIGSDVHIMGHPGGLYYSYIAGKVSAYHDHIKLIHKLGPFIQVSAPVYNGNSGGGAFDNEGRLIGIASFMPPMPSTGCFVSYVSINKFLADVVSIPISNTGK